MALAHTYVGCVQVTKLKSSEQLDPVASEQKQKEASIKDVLEEQLAQVTHPIYTY